MLKIRPDVPWKGTKVSLSCALFMVYAFKKDLSRVQKYRYAIIEL